MAKNNFSDYPAVKILIIVLVATAIGSLFKLVLYEQLFLLIVLFVISIKEVRPVSRKFLLVIIL